MVDESNLSDEVIKQHELLGHVGMNKLYNLMIKSGHREANLHETVVKCISNCLPCAERKQNNTKMNPSQHIISTYPMEKIMTDITGPLTPCSRRGARYILGIVDVFSRYPMLIPLAEISTKKICDILFSKWISIFRFPKEIITDNARNFTSRILRDSCDN